MPIGKPGAALTLAGTIIAELLCRSARRDSTHGSDRSHQSSIDRAKAIAQDVREKQVQGREVVELLGEPKLRRFGALGPASHLTNIF